MDILKVRTDKRGQKRVSLPPGIEAEYVGIIPLSIEEQIKAGQVELVKEGSGKHTAYYLKSKDGKPLY